MVALGVLGKYPISVEFQAHCSANPHSREPVPLTVESIGLRERIRAAIRSQTKSNVNVLSSLHAVLDDLGYVPQEAIEEVAEHMDTTINEVWGVASFYTNFRFTPPGDNIVEICWGPTCHLLGAPDILDAVQNELGLADEGETEDNRISLKYNTCLGACSQAPVMMVNHRLAGRIDAQSAVRRVAGLEAGAGH